MDPTSSSPKASQAAGDQRDSPPRYDPDSQPDPFTGRFSGLSSHLGEKREVEGTHAHHLDNAKAIRSETATHAPPLALSAEYEKEIKPPRKRHLARPQEPQPTEEPRTLPRIIPRSQSRNCLGRLTSRRGAPPTSNAAAGTSTSVSGHMPPQRNGNIAPNAPQGTTSSDPLSVHPNCIVALLAAWSKHGDGTHLDHEAACRKWLELSEQERVSVLQLYGPDQPRAGGSMPTTTAALPTSEPQHANGQRTRVLDQLLLAVDQKSASTGGSGQPMHQPAVKHPSMVIHHPQAMRLTNLEDPGRVDTVRPTSRMWEQRTPSQRDVYHHSAHVPALQMQFTPQDAPIPGTTGSTHVHPTPMTGVSASMHAPMAGSTHVAAAETQFAHTGMTGVSGLMYSSTSQMPFTRQEASMVGTAGSTHVLAPTPMTGVSASMHAPTAQMPFTRQEAPMTGMAGFTHIPAVETQFAHGNTRMTGVQGTMYGASQVPFTGQDAPMAGMAGSMFPPSASGEDFLSTTPPPEHGPEITWGSSIHTALPFPDGMDDLGFVLGKGKGRARDVEMTVPPRESQDCVETSMSSPQPRLSPMNGQLQGDVSGHLNQPATIAFLKCLNGLSGVIEDQTQEMRALRETVEDHFDAQPEVTSPTTTSSPARTGGKKKSTSRAHSQPHREDITLRMRRRQKRVEQKVTRLRGGRAQSSKTSNVVAQMVLDDEDLEEDLTRLRARLRKAFEEMLQITDWADVYHMYPPLTSDQLTLYKARDATIVPTANNLRIDFHLGWSKPFNREAREVFIDRYLERVQNGNYSKYPTPPQLLTRECIGMILDGQMTNYRLKWRRSKTPLTADQLAKQARAACRRSRKRTLHESREALLLRRGYTRHVRFFKLLEPVHMSGDETDGETKTHPPKWGIIVARWQSAELRNFLWEVDRMYREDWGHPPHKRATGGNPPRDRVLRSGPGEDGVVQLGREEDSVAPRGLWRNCYDETWLKQQAPHFISELDIDDEDYDFTL